MEPSTTPTHPPRDDPITPEELARHDGSNPDLPVYVAIKGIVFDVNPRREMYLPGKGYHIFAGKDASSALGKSSLDPKDAVADTSSLTDEENKVLNDWLDYYTKVCVSGKGQRAKTHVIKRYNIVGKVATT